MVLISIKYSRKFGNTKTLFMFKYGLDKLTVGKVLDILNVKIKAKITLEVQKKSIQICTLGENHPLKVQGDKRINLQRIHDLSTD